MRAQRVAAWRRAGQAVESQVEVRARRSRSIYGVFASKRAERRVRVRTTTSTDGYSEASQ